MYRITEQDEYLLSLLLDNDLPAEQAIALRRRLDEDSELRACFDALARVDRALVARRADQPAVNLEGFHANLMRAIAAPATVSDEDEFLLSRRLDRDLSESEEQALRRRLEAEPVLQEHLESLGRVDAALARKREDQPKVDYGRFHRKVMKRIEAEAASLGRTIRFPVWARIAVPLAAAAAILLAVWLGPAATRPLNPNPGGVDQLAKLSDDASATGEGGVEFTMTGQRQEQPELVIELVANRPPADPAANGEEPSEPSGTPDKDTTIQVSYARSTQLAEAIEKVDNERANQPVRKALFFASAKPPASAKPAGAEGDFLDVAPM